MGLDWSRAFSPSMVQYGNAKFSEHKWKMENDVGYRNKIMTPPPPPPTHTPYTTMSNVNVGASAIAGGSLTIGGGHTRNEYGEILTCGTVAVCGTAGAEESAYGSGGQSYINSSSSKGFSTTVSASVSGKAAAVVGGSAQAC